jgi:hypothetical protein
VISLERLGAHALSLPDVRERTSGSRRGWYVAGRVVARQEDEDFVMVRCGFIERERLLVDHPETFSVPPHMESHMKVLVDLVRGDESAALDAVTAAWVLQRHDR